MSEQQERTMYQVLGEEAGLRQLVERFYHHMDTLPDAKPIRDMHQADLTEAKEKLFLFLSGWSGGPSLYIERYGHPMLRARHLPFAIDKRARDLWLQCMLLALEDVGIQEPELFMIMDSFLKVATHMRNREG